MLDDYWTANKKKPIDNSRKLLHVAYCNKSIIEEWKFGAKKEIKTKKKVKKNVRSGSTIRSKSCIQFSKW